MPASDGKAVIVVPGVPAMQASKITQNNTELLNRMDEMNNTIQDQTKMIRDQIDLVSHYFTALKGFSDAIPAMPDSMQPAVDEHRRGNGYAQPSHDVNQRSSPRVCERPLRPGGDGSADSG